MILLQAIKGHFLSVFQVVTRQKTGCLVSRFRMSHNNTEKQTQYLSETHNILQHSSKLTLAFTQYLPSSSPSYVLYLSPLHHVLIPIISSKKPQDINLPYVSFSLIWKKKPSHFLLFRGGPYCSITLWSNSDQLYLALLLQARPGLFYLRYIVCRKASEPTWCLCSGHQFTPTTLSQVFYKSITM